MPINKGYRCRNFVIFIQFDSFAPRKIFSFFILERSVLGCMARISAAPCSPLIRQLLPVKTFSICSFSMSSREETGFVCILESSPPCPSTPSLAYYCHWKSRPAQSHSSIHVCYPAIDTPACDSYQTLKYFENVFRVF